MAMVAMETGARPDLVVRKESSRDINDLRPDLILKSRYDLDSVTTKSE